MLGLTFLPSIYLYAGATDMRKNFDGLIGLVTTYMGKNPLKDGAFVFVNRPRDKMKILIWDRHGFWLLYKRLEAGRFQIPPFENGNDSINISYEQLVMIIEGIDLKSVRRRKRYKICEKAA
jgi:transposase